MTYKEALSFTGRCLTLDRMPERIPAIRECIRNGMVDWVKIVRLSSAHLVLPALHLQLERAGMINELPGDLVEYLDSVTQKNRQRNRQIIEQAREIAQLVNQHHLAPIYLKGTAHLLKPLYEDIGERMVGDIDFLIKQEEVLPTVHLLQLAGYTPLAEFWPDSLKTMKHYPRLVNPVWPAGVEVHMRVVPSPHDRRFSFADIEREKESIPGELKLYIPSERHLIIHNALNAQISDKVSYFGNPSLRQMYDLFRLSSYRDPRKVLEDFSFYRHRTRAWLTMTAKAMDCQEVVSVRETWQSWLLCQPMNLMLKNRRFLFRTYQALVYLTFRLVRYGTVLLNAVIKRSVMKDLWSKLRNPRWYPLHIDSYRSFFANR